MSKTIDPRSHVGETHGIYALVDVLDEKDKYGHWVYKGVCIICGREKFSHYGGFSGPKSVSITCNHLDATGRFIQPVKWSNKRIRNIFSGMKSRCYCESDRDYKYYGEKGIRICDEWLDNPILFEKWALVNGYDNNLTIDRIDELKDYCPDNCRWITLNDNAKYKSTTSYINVDEEIHTGKDWSNILGLGINTINIYVRKYGLENTIEFIRRYKSNSTLKPKHKQSCYDLYMNN